MNARHGHFGGVFFFFFCMRTPRRTCVHFAGLAYMYAKKCSLERSVIIYLSKYPCLEQVAFFCHLFNISIFYFSVIDSTLLCLRYVQLWPLLVLFSNYFSNSLPFSIVVCKCVILIHDHRPRSSVYRSLFCVYVSMIFLCVLVFHLPFFVVVVAFVSFTQRKDPRLTS